MVLGPLSPPTPVKGGLTKPHHGTGGISIKSISPPQNAILRVSDRRETAETSMSVNREYASEGGLMDLVRSPLPLYGDYLSPPFTPMGGPNGPSTSVVIL